MEIKPIATIENDFTDKFAIPRQSLLAKIKSKIVFEKEYSDINAIRGLAGYSHIWLIWGLSKNIKEKHSLTVRPPRLGGNERVGVFASRSPFRPNNIGLSCVELTSIENNNLIVSGADLMNGTPIYDIKPYIPYCDCIKNARGGFTDETPFRMLNVEIDNDMKNRIEKEKWEVLKDILKNDPRPAYQNDEKRIYGFRFSDYEIKFKVKGNTLTVVEIENEQ